VDVRVIAATNKDLEGAVRDGAFREDLYHRLNVIQLHTPPLRERKSDIPLLATHFLTQKCREIGGKNIRGFQESAIALLTSHSWPGNVRELENRIEQAVVFATGDWISAADIQLDAKRPFNANNRSLPELVEEHERTLILDALERTADQKAAAEVLSIPEPTLRYKMDKHGIQRRRSQPERKNLR
jgi:DNA-binding NtrC family response regulator